MRALFCCTDGLWQTWRQIWKHSAKGRTSRESNSFLPGYQKYLFRSESVVFLWWQLPANLLVSTKTITDPVANVCINFHIAWKEGNFLWICVYRVFCRLHSTRKVHLQLRSEGTASHWNLGSSRNTDATSESISTVAAYSCLLLHERSFQSCRSGLSSDSGQEK